ncbi:MAG: hypothetical protein ACI4F7_03555 [Acutalibacteraceae bacterium]
MKKKTAAAVAVFALVLCFAAGGTLAWLTAKTATVTNTFTKGDVAISLTETWNTDTNFDSQPDAWQAQMIPGNEYGKDPKVEVLGDTNVDCWLFVKFEELNDAALYLDYTSKLTAADGWTQGDGSEIPLNVWYREVKAADSVKEWYLLDGNKVSVKSESVTKENMDVASRARLVYTAYAAQKDNLTAKEAWALF